MTLKSHQNLCETCNSLDLRSYFQSAKDSRIDDNGWVGATSSATKLGSLEDIYMKSSRCSFCAAVTYAVCEFRSWCMSVPEDKISWSRTKRNGPIECLIFSYCFAFDKAEHGPGREAYRLGIASQTSQGCYGGYGQHIGDIQLMVDSEDIENYYNYPLFYGRAIPASGRLNMELPRKWLDCCESKHADICESTKVSSLPLKDLLVIDVKNLCICSCPTHARYLALSYCWALGETFKLSKANVTNLQRPASLESEMKDLPLTIQDAINFVRELGEQYLWVDALCIVQDDEEYRRLQIRQMDSIYSSAIVTLVSAHETHDPVKACSGLPCYRPNTRERVQRVFKAQGLTLSVPFEAVISLLMNGRWMTRAWTYSELLLSKRVIYFTSTQVYFQCAAAVFCEDSFGEEASPNPYITPVGNLWNPGNSSASDESRNYFGSLHLPAAPASDSAAIKNYAFHVANFTKGQLTVASDILNAFKGIQNVMQKYLNSEFLYGLPLRFIDKCLLWIHKDTFKRRSVLTSASSTNCFPSWSWAGWEGNVDLNTYFVPENTKSEVAWYLADEDGTRMRIKINDFEGRIPSYPQPGNKDVSTIKSANVDDTKGTKTQPLSRLPTHLQSIHLACHSSITALRIDGRTTPDSLDAIWPYSANFNIFDRADAWAGSILLDRGLAAQLLRQPRYMDRLFEFMLVSRSIRMEVPACPHARFFDDGVFQPRPWCVLNVMLVERKGDMVMRLGVGVVHEDAWVGARPVEAFLTLL